MTTSKTALLIELEPDHGRYPVSNLFSSWNQLKLKVESNKVIIPELIEIWCRERSVATRVVEAVGPSAPGIGCAQVGGGGGGEDTVCSVVTHWRRHLLHSLQTGAGWGGASCQEVSGGGHQLPLGSRRQGVSPQPRGRYSQHHLRLTLVMKGV